MDRPSAPALRRTSLALTSALLASALACGSEAAPLVERLEQAASPDEVALVVLDLLRNHGAAGEKAVRDVARAHPLLEYEPVHGILLQYDPSSGRLRQEIVAADYQPLSVPGADAGTVAAVNAAYLESRGGREWSFMTFDVPAAEAVALHTFSKDPHNVVFVLERNGGPWCHGLRATFESGQIRQWTVFEVPHEDLQRMLAERARVGGGR